jgi:hypothetical protein
MEGAPSTYAMRSELAAWRDVSAPIPEPTPPLRRRTRLCIGMATYDDFDGVWFSVAGTVASPDAPATPSQRTH